jgi:integrase
VASLLDRSTGYYCQFYDSDRSPSRKRFSLKTKRKRKARQKITELERAYEDGEFDPWTDDPFDYEDPCDGPLTLAKAIEQFTAEKEQQGCAERTVSTYENVWGRFTDTLEGERIELSDLTPEQIEAFVHDRSIAESTRHKRWRHVRAVLNHFNRTDASENVTPPQRPDKLPTPVRRDDLSAVIGSLKEDYRDKRRRNCVRPGQVIWAVAPIKFAFYTGLRASEIGRLKWKHIDTERGLIRITEQKNGREQTVPLISKAVDVLDDTPRPRGPECYVFRTPDGPIRDRNAEAFGRRCSRRWCRARQECEDVGEKTFHDLRAGFATALADAGMGAHQIRDAMRHADISTSLAYVRASNQRLKSDMESAFS